MDSFERRVALKRIDDIQKKLNEGLAIEGYLASRLQAVRNDNKALFETVQELTTEVYSK